MNANTIFLIIQLLIYFLLISCLIVGDTFLTYMVFNSNTYTCETFQNTSSTNAATTLPATTLPATTLPATTLPATTLPATTLPATTLPATTLPSTTLPATTLPATTLPATTLPATTLPATTLPATTLPSNNNTNYLFSTCYNLTNTQLGFIRFKIIMFWILFIAVSGALMFTLVKLYTNNTILFGIIIVITFIMSIVIIVGGVFMTQYGFTGIFKNCLDSSNSQIKLTQYCYNINQTELNFSKISVIFGWLYSFIAIITIGLFIWEKNIG